MGLVAAALGAAGGVIADQWKEYFYCEAIANDTIMVKGQKKTSNRSTNTKGTDNIITSGSIITVADGQCMIIVDQGKVAEVCAEPGEFVYDASTEPSVFNGKLGDSLVQSFKTFGKRFTFGGLAPKDQRVYYFNTKELIGNKYGTASPIPFRVVDERARIDIDISVKCFGEYSYHVIDPVAFYTNVCGNVATEYKRDQLDSQLKSELLTHLQPAFAKLSAMGIRYSAVLAHTTELAKIMNEELTQEWKETRGIEIMKFGVSSIKADEEDEKMLKELQKNAAFVDPNYRNANLAGATMTAMNTAAGNAGGAAVGFMGMNMATGFGAGMATGFGVADQQIAAQQQAMQQQAPVQQAAAPAAGGWKCSCGATATGNFCPECGSPKPVDNGWTCSCGTVNKGKFCSNCGSPKPAGAPLYKCDKCGWEPEDPKNPPKFCPECGDPFNEADIVK